MLVLSKHRALKSQTRAKYASEHARQERTRRGHIGFPVGRINQAKIVAETREHAGATMSADYIGKHISSRSLS